MEAVQAILDEVGTPLVGLNDIKSSKMSATDCLAPHPVYFSVDGRPATASTKVDGQPWIAYWNGRTLRLIEGGGSGNGNGGFNHNQTPDWNPNFKYTMLVMLIVGIYLWYRIIKWIFF